MLSLLKSQAYSVIWPLGAMDLEASKLTVSGAGPVSGVKVKSAERRIDEMLTVWV